MNADIESPRSDVQALAAQVDELAAKVDALTATVKELPELAREQVADAIGQLAYDDTVNAIRALPDELAALRERLDNEVTTD